MRNLYRVTAFNKTNMLHGSSNYKEGHPHDLILEI